MKACTECLAEPVILALNYNTENRNVPDSWDVGVDQQYLNSANTI